MMNRNEFFNYLAENVQMYLPPFFEDAQVSIEENIKENGRKIPALVIRRQSDSTVPFIPLEEIYDDYMSGNSLDASIKRIVDWRIQLDNLECLSDLGYLKDYEKVKDKLRIKLCDPELNQEWLNDKAYTLQGDFAAVYYVVIYEGEEQDFSTPVVKQLMEEWKVTLKQLHEDALLSERAKQAFFFEMDDYLCSMMTGNGTIRNLLDGKTKWHPEIAETPILCLTDSSMKNGASMVLQEELMKQVGEIIGSDFYVLPSSIHEILLVPDIGIVDTSGLSRIVKEINETSVELCDKLSDKVQYYDRAKGAFENAERRNQTRSFAITNGEFYPGKELVFI